MASKILKMGSRVIFWVGEPPQKFFSKSEGVGEIMLFYFNFDLLEEFSDQDAGFNNEVDLGMDTRN